MVHGDRLTIAAGMLLGVGLGGFVDGILFHQVLQWHEMISSVLPPVTLVAVKVNMLWVGVFHIFAWVMTALGVITLAHAADAERQVPVPRPLGASFAIGMGLFNVVEGIIDHQILGLHHVHPGAWQTAWDIGFIVVGAALALAGARELVRSMPTLRLRPAV
jgi:uncharacterized membrane protein